MNNLILVRHGQSLWNKERRFTGWADINLTDDGKFEAKKAGMLIKELDLDFHNFFTSNLKRAINTLEIILEVINKPNANIIKATELNERHYGNLTSLNKDEITKKYGKEKVHIWRRSFDVPPPAMDLSHPYKNIIDSNIAGESLKDTYNRVIPYYEKKIEPLIKDKKNILISFHGNSCRALLMKILKISKKKIVSFEIPTGNPLLIKFDDKLKVKEKRYLDPARAKKILFNI